MGEYARTERLIAQYGADSREYAAQASIVRAMEGLIRSSRERWEIDHDGPSGWSWSPPASFGGRLCHIYTSWDEALSDVSRVADDLDQASYDADVARSECRGYLAELSSIDGGDYWGQW